MIGSLGRRIGRLSINLSWTLGFLNTSKNKQAMVPDVVSDPARSISAIWSTTSLGCILTSVFGIWPLSRRCWRRSGRALSGLVLRFFATAVIACPLMLISIMPTLSNPTYGNHLPWPIKHKIKAKLPQETFEIDQLIPHEIFISQIGPWRWTYLVPTRHPFEDSCWYSLPNVLVNLKLRLPVWIRLPKPTAKGAFAHANIGWYQKAVIDCKLRFGLVDTYISRARLWRTSIRSVTAICPFPEFSEDSSRFSYRLIRSETHLENRNSRPSTYPTVNAGERNLFSSLWGFGRLYWTEWAPWHVLAPRLLTFPQTGQGCFGPWRSQHTLRPLANPLSSKCSSVLPYQISRLVAVPGGRLVRIWDVIFRQSSILSLLQTNSSNAMWWRGHKMALECGKGETLQLSRLLESTWGTNRKEGKLRPIADRKMIDWPAWWPSSMISSKNVVVWNSHTADLTL